MATYATDLTVLDACDSATGWSELPSPHASGAAPAADTENYFHNGTSVSQATGQATGQGAGIQFDNGANLTWPVASNWVVLFWTYYAAPTNLLAWASGGMRLGIGSADNNADMYNAMGVDFAKYPYGGWQNTAIDPEFATPDQTIGTGGGSYRNFAILPNIATKITKGSPLAVDVLRYGRGELQVTGTAATFGGMATANDNATTARWGLFQLFGKGYEWKGLMSLGLAATSTTFSDSNVSISVEDTPRVLAGFNKIEVNNAASSITWNTVNISGVETSITGLAPISPGDFVAVDNATISKTSCTFTDMGTFIYQSNSTITSCIYRRCQLVTQGGATMTDNIFASPEGAVALLSADLALVTGSTFNSDGTGHAVELSSIGAGSMDWNNTESGYAATDGSTGNETIYVNVASGNLTINVISGASTPTIRTAGAVVTVIAGAVPVKVTSVLEDGSPLGDVNVILRAANATGPFPYKESATITSTGTVATVTHTGHGMDTNDKVDIKGVTNGSEYNGVKQITVIDVNTYTYVLGSPQTSPAAGTIESTFVALQGITDSVTGTLSTSRTYSTDQPVTGHGRKSTSPPYYKTGNINSTISSSTGLDAVSLLILD